MRYVIIRDDDTNATTPSRYLEQLYRPFLARGFPVNLAVIPNVNTRAKNAEGRPEGFLRGDASVPTRTIAENKELLDYLKREPHFKILLHGYDHELYEFEKYPGPELARRLDQGLALLAQAGLERPQTFVAPYDRISPAAYRELAARFDLISTGWFELKRLPRAWWPQYFVKKLSGKKHWRAGGVHLLSHPGCLLSCNRDYATMLNQVKAAVESQNITVLVTHWWEYFRNDQPDQPFIKILHQVADYLSSNQEIKVISFTDVIKGPPDLSPRPPHQ